MIVPSWEDPPVEHTIALEIAKQPDEGTRRFKTDPRLQIATAAYIELLELGGRVEFADLSEELFHRHLAAGRAGDALTRGAATPTCPPFWSSSTRKTGR